MTYIVLSKKNDFLSYVDDFNDSLEGISSIILSADSVNIRIQPRQMMEALNEVQFEFYNYSDEFKRKQTLSTVYCLIPILGNDFLKENKSRVIVRGLGAALLYQRVLRQLLQVQEELVAINLQHLQANNQKAIRTILPVLLDSLAPKNNTEKVNLGKFIHSMDKIIEFLKQKSKL